MNRDPIVLRTSRPSLALGCGGLLALALILGVGIGSCVVFLESGANEGEITLQTLEAYPLGTVDFEGEHNIFLVRTPGGALLALSDLDAANRAAAGTRCRAQLVPLDSPIIDPAFAARVTADAANSTAVLREDCNGAVYDAAGIRLDADGPNLDRHPVTLDDRGRVIVDLNERTCSIRDGRTDRAPVECVE